MSLSSLLIAFLMFCKTHPAEVTMAVGALSSLCYKYLDKYPRCRAVFEALAHAGFNLPAFANAVTKLLTGGAKIVTMALMVGIVACAALTAEDKADLTAYEAQQSACIAANPGNKAAIDACRSAVKKDWCSRWASKFDAGVCQ